MYFRLNPRIPGTVYRSVFTFSFYPVTHFLEHGNFWNPNISQASVATCERCDDSIWVSTRGPKETCSRWGPNPPHRKRHLWGLYVFGHSQTCPRSGSQRCGLKCGSCKKLKFTGRVVKFGLPAKPQLRMRYGWRRSQLCRPHWHMHTWQCNIARRAIDCPSMTTA